MLDDDKPTLTAGALRIVAASMDCVMRDRSAFEEVLAGVAALPSDADVEAVSACWVSLVNHLRAVPLDQLPAVFDALSSDQSQEALTALHWFTCGVIEERLVAEVTDQTT